MTTRSVELGRVWGSPDDGDWDTVCVDIPGDTPEDQIEEVALKQGMEDVRQDQNSLDALVHMFVYHINVVEFITPEKGEADDA